MSASSPPKQRSPLRWSVGCLAAHLAQSPAARLTRSPPRAQAKIEAAKALVAKEEAAPGAAVPEQLKLGIAAAAQAVQEAIGAAKGWEPSAATLDAAVAVTQGGAKLEKVVSAKRGDGAAQGALERAASKVTEAHDALEAAVVAVMDAGGATAAQRADAAAKVLEAQDSLGAAIKLAPQASLKELGEVKDELAKAATAASAAAAAS